MVLNLCSRIKNWGISVHKWAVACYCKLRFILFILFNDFFFKGNSKDLLRLMKRFVELSWRSQPNSVSITKRDLKSSYSLFSSLIETYLETYSEVTLNQVIEVFKMEIIEREKYGRKQF